MSFWLVCEQLRHSNGRRHSFIGDWIECAVVTPALSSAAGMLCLLIGQVHTPEIQQSLRVSGLVHWSRLDPRPHVHDLHTNGGCDQNHSIRWTPHRGESVVPTTKRFFINEQAYNVAICFPPEDQSGGGTCEGRSQFLPSGVPAQMQRAGTAAGPQLERRLDEAHPHHSRNYDVKRSLWEDSMTCFSITYICVYIYVILYTYTKNILCNFWHSRRTRFTLLRICTRSPCFVLFFYRGSYIFLSVFLIFLS